MKTKIKLDKTKKCKCGKPMPCIPYSCSDCHQSSLCGAKIEVVKFGKKKLPSGIILE